MKIVIRAAIQTTHQISLLSLKPLLDHPGKHPKYYSCLSKYGPAQTSARIMKREQTRLLAEWFADVNHFWSQTENRVCCRKLFSVETLFMPSFCRRVFAARHLLDANPHLDSHPIFVIFMMRNLLVSSAACFFNVSGELVCFPANRFNPKTPPEDVICSAIIGAFIEKGRYVCEVAELCLSRSYARGLKVTYNEGYFVRNFQLCSETHYNS